MRLFETIRSLCLPRPASVPRPRDPYTDALATADAVAGRTPRVGDLVDLPPYLPAELFRVLDVTAHPDLPGWVVLDGYLIGPPPRCRQHLASYTVPVAEVRVRPEHWLTDAAAVCGLAEGGRR